MKEIRYLCRMCNECPLYDVQLEWCMHYNQKVKEGDKLLICNVHSIIVTEE